MKKLQKCHKNYLLFFYFLYIMCKYSFTMEHSMYHFTHTIVCETTHSPTFKQLVKDYKSKQINSIEKVDKQIKIAFPMVSYSVNPTVFHELQKVSGNSPV